MPAVRKSLRLHTARPPRTSVLGRKAFRFCRLRRSVPHLHEQNRQTSDFSRALVSLVCVPSARSEAGYVRMVPAPSPSDILKVDSDMGPGFLSPPQCCPRHTGIHSRFVEAATGPLTRVGDLFPLGEETRAVVHSAPPCVLLLGNRLVKKIVSMYCIFCTCLHF